jgi:YD repeat-containing protein
LNKSGLLQKIITVMLCLSLALPSVPLNAKGSIPTTLKGTGQGVEVKPAASPPPSMMQEQEHFPEPPVEQEQWMGKSGTEARPPLPDGKISVGQATYGEEIPSAILSIKAKTLQKQGLLESASLDSASSSRSYAAPKNQSQDLTKTEIEQLFLAGASKEEVYGVNLLIQYKPDQTPLELLKWRHEGKFTWEEMQQKLKDQEASRTEQPSVPDAVYKDEGGFRSFIQRQSVTALVYGVDSISADDLKSAAIKVTPFDRTVSSIFDGLVKQAQINQTNKPQFGDRDESSEHVDPVSGSLTWKENEIHLPGRDGLDLNIGIMYNSNQVHAFQREQASTGSYTTKSDYYLSRYNLGIGWSLQFPSLQSQNGYTYYHDGQGGVFAVASYPQNGDELTQYTHFANYKSKNMRIFSSHEFNNGQEQSYSCVEYADKRREYFSARGLLLGIVDRFGNTITFKHTLIQSSGFNMEVISSITDTLERVVTFEYENNLSTEGDFYGENVTIRVKDGSKEVEKVTLTKGRIKTTVNELVTYVPVLWVITDQKGDETFFEYDYQFAVYDPWSGQQGYQDYNYYSLLKEVTYPHSKTTYSYDQTVRRISSTDSVQEYRVISRGDTAGSKRYNQNQYRYEGDYTGYPDYSPPFVPNDYRFYSTVTLQSNTASNRMSTTRTFDGKARLLSTDTQAANGERKVVTNTAFHELFQNSPTRTTISDYGVGDSDSTANHLFKETTYTNWGWVGTETKPLTSDQFNNPHLKQRYTTTMSYEPKYHLMESKSWYQNETDASPVSERYTYTLEGRPLTVTNALGEQTTFSYNYTNGTGQISQATAEKTANGQRVAKSVTHYGAETNYAYPTEQQQWFNINMPEQTIVKTTMAYDMRMGRLIRKSDGNHQTVSYEYERGGRLKKETYPDRTNANGEKYSEVVEYNYIHTTSGNFDSVNAGTPVLKVDTIKTVTQSTNGNTAKTYANTLYNGMGLALLEEKWNENVGKWIFMQYHYDDLGRPVYQRDDLGNEITVGYDVWGQANRSTDAYGNVYVTDYDLKQRKTTSYMVAADTQERLNYLETAYDPWGQVLSKRTYKDWPSQSHPMAESYRYDILGNVVGYIDPVNHLNDAGVTTRYSYDALNRLTAVQDALNQTTRYSYDGNGQLAKVTVQAKNGAEETLNTKSYNEIGLLKVKQDASLRSESITYNQLGQLVGKTDRNGSVFGYSYDEHGQLMKSTVSGTINDVPQTQATEVIFGDGAPRNQTMKTSIQGVVRAKQELGMDNLDQARKSYSTIYSPDGSASHTAYVLNQRDALGRITQLNDSFLNFYVNYQYNKERLDKVQTNGSAGLTGDASANVQYNYFANNLVKSITYPPLTGGSILRTEYTYNKALNWVESVTNKKDEAVLSAFSYGYDNNGNITSVTETRNGTTQTTTYGYDGLNRLTTTVHPGGGRDAYTYDVRGNRLTLEQQCRGRTSLFQDTSYSYDLQNTLTSLTKGSNKTDFTYYADGLRFKKVTGTNQTQYNYNFNGEVITEEKNGTQKANYVRGDRVLVKKDTNTSTDYYYLYNGHGDVVQIVDTSGTPVNSYSYDEWGNITSQTEGISNPFKYTGEIYDEETGLYYLRARYYDPSIGRFLNEDTV